MEAVRGSRTVEAAGDPERVAGWAAHRRPHRRGGLRLPRVVDYHRSATAPHHSFGFDSNKGDVKVE